MATKRVKYMGTADVRLIEKGDNFGGQLHDGIASTLRFDESNAWTVDVGDLPSEVVECLLAEPDFKDVTDLKRIPFNANQMTFRPTPQNAKSEENPDLVTAEDDSDERKVSGSSTPGAGAPAAGGRGRSTAGAATD